MAVCRYWRWLGLLILFINNFQGNICWPTLPPSSHNVKQPIRQEYENDDSRKVLGSSVVTSVSVVMDHGNGSKTYLPPDGGFDNAELKLNSIGSPANLMNPDRYEFYTFDETGDLVKRLMTWDEIQSLIAGGDTDGGILADASLPVYYNEPALSVSAPSAGEDNKFIKGGSSGGQKPHITANEFQISPDLHGVHKVVQSVQNVLKSELAASQSKIPPVAKPGLMANPPGWSLFLPGLLDSSDDGTGIDFNNLHNFIHSPDNGYHHNHHHVRSTTTTVSPPSFTSHPTTSTGNHFTKNPTKKPENPFHRFKSTTTTTSTMKPSTVSSATSVNGDKNRLSHPTTTTSPVSSSSYSTPSITTFTSNRPFNPSTAAQMVSLYNTSFLSQSTTWPSSYSSSSSSSETPHLTTSYGLSSSHSTYQTRPRPRPPQSSIPSSSSSTPSIHVTQTPSPSSTAYYFKPTKNSGSTAKPFTVTSKLPISSSTKTTAASTTTTISSSTNPLFSSSSGTTFSVNGDLYTSIANVLSQVTDETKYTPLLASSIFPPAASASSSSNDHLSSSVNYTTDSSSPPSSSWSSSWPSSSSSSSTSLSTSQKYPSTSSSDSTTTGIYTKITNATTTSPRPLVTDTTSLEVNIVESKTPENYLDDKNKSTTKPNNNKHKEEIVVITTSSNKPIGTATTTVVGNKYHQQAFAPLTIKPHKPQKNQTIFEQVSSSITNSISGTLSTSSTMQSQHQRVTPAAPYTRPNVTKRPILTSTTDAPSPISSSQNYIVYMSTFGKPTTNNNSSTAYTKKPAISSQTDKHPSSTSSGYHFTTSSINPTTSAAAVTTPPTTSTTTTSTTISTTTTTTGAVADKLVTEQYVSHKVSPFIGDVDDENNYSVLEKSTSATFPSVNEITDQLRDNLTMYPIKLTYMTQQQQPEDANDKVQSSSSYSVFNQTYPTGAVTPHDFISSSISSNAVPANINLQQSTTIDKSNDQQESTTKVSLVPANINLQQSAATIDKSNDQQESTTKVSSFLTYYTNYVPLEPMATIQNQSKPPTPAASTTFHSKIADKRPTVVFNNSPDNAHSTLSDVVLQKIPTIDPPAKQMTTTHTEVGTNSNSNNNNNKHNQDGHFQSTTNTFFTFTSSSSHRPVTMTTEGYAASTGGQTISYEKIYSSALDEEKNKPTLEEDDAIIENGISAVTNILLGTESRISSSSPNQQHHRTGIENRIVGNSIADDNNAGTSSSTLNSAAKSSSIYLTDNGHTTESLNYQQQGVRRNITTEVTYFPPEEEDAITSGTAVSTIIPSIVVTTNSDITGISSTTADNKRTTIGRADTTDKSTTSAFDKSQYGNNNKLPASLVNNSSLNAITTIGLVGVSTADYKDVQTVVTMSSDNRTTTSSSSSSSFMKSSSAVIPSSAAAATVVTTTTSSSSASRVPQDGSNLREADGDNNYIFVVEDDDTKSTDNQSDKSDNFSVVTERFNVSSSTSSGTSVKSTTEVKNNSIRNSSNANAMDYNFKKKIENNTLNFPTNTTLTTNNGKISETNQNALEKTIPVETEEEEEQEQEQQRLATISPLSPSSVASSSSSTSSHSIVITTGLPPPMAKSTIATISSSSSTASKPTMVSPTNSPPVDLPSAPHESMGLEASTSYLSDDIRRFVELCNEISFKIWTAHSGKGFIASRSMVMSPFAAISTLAMIFLGARGSSSGQMNDFLHLDDMVTFNPHQVLQNVTESTINAKNIGVVNTAFAREVYSDKAKGKILDFYKERVQQYYEAHVEEINFNSIGDLVRRRTNLLVKRQTLGRIQDYLRGSALVLKPPLATLAANIFQTDCNIGSTDGRDGEMYFVVRPSTRQRRLVPIPAVVFRSGFLAGYEPGLDATAITLSPESVVSTILVLPGQQGQVAPGDGLARLEQRLLESSYRRGAWSRLLRSLLFRPGLELQIPRFSHRSVLNLTNGLQRLGLGEVFAYDRADLRGINGLSNELYLSDVIQVNTFSTCGEDVIGARHHIETYPSSPQRVGRRVSRRIRRRSPDQYDGVDTAFYASLPLNLRPRQARLPDIPRLRYDRPFLYIVRHNPTGMILYIGRFNPRLLP